MILLALSSALMIRSPQGAGDAVDPRGPIANLGMRVSATPGSVQTIGYTYRNEAANQPPFSAKWIWLDPQSSGGKPTAGLFRKVVQLDAAPANFRVRVSADVIYRLYVNGKLVARGPADIGRDYDREERGPRWLYDVRDLPGSTLHRGENVISAEVFTDGFVGSRVSRGKHGLLFEAKLDFSDGSSQMISGDSTWRAIADSAWHGGGEYDETKEIPGWRLPGFDDSAWRPCSRVTSVWTPLVASELPPLMEARYPIQPENQAHLSTRAKWTPMALRADSTVEIKYDRVIAAYPTLKIDGAQGATLRIVPGERVGDQSRVCTLKLRDGIQTYEYPFLDSFSALRLELTNLPPRKTVKLLDVGANFSSMPLKYQGSFTCSDPHLNDLWATCRWLTQICMQTHHLDSPNHQEPICDPGDYLIESHANDYAFGSPWLARQDLRKFGLLLKDLNYRNFHTSYSLLWLQMLLTYYDYTGDAALLRELSPEVNGLLDTFTGWRGKNGLISEAPNYMFMDWVTIAGFECHHPPAVIGQGYMTAFYYRALLDGMRVAALMKDSVREGKYRALRQDVAVAFNRELWDAEKGLYRDGKPNQTSVPSYQWLPADKDLETFSPHVNTLAVLYDLAPPEAQAAIIDRFMKEEPLNCEPYFTYFVLEALAHSGRFEKYAPGLIARWKIVPETHTFHEMWVEGDLSHAWGSAPLIQMSSTVLGVRPLSPGFDRISIRPTLFGLTWAKGTIPTPHGPVDVSWSRAGDRFTIEARVPSGTVAELTPPGTTGNPIRWGPGHHKTIMSLISPPVSHG